MKYKDIQSCHKRLFNATIKTCWIADVKRRLGIPVRKAANRKGAKILNRCPNKHFHNIASIIKGQVVC